MARKGGAVLDSGLPPAQRTGRAGEDYTAGWLLRQGYQLLARNWRCPWGELDLIAARGDTVAFVEVKARRPGSMTTPLEAVDARKRRKLLRAATAWLQETGCPLQPRMDAAAVTIEEREGRELICAFEYYEGAFDGGEYG